MTLEIHRRGNRWIGRFHGVHAWGRTFAECGSQLAYKCPELGAALLRELLRQEHARPAGNVKRLASADENLTNDEK